MAKLTISFKPRQVTKKMLRELQDRAAYVVTNRFGLETGEPRTLDSIGQEYGITRERVRQIENFALNALRKSASFEEAREIFEELYALVDALGGIVPEDELLGHISDDKVTQNHIHLYLVLGEGFEKHKEDKKFRTRWSVDTATKKEVEDALERLYQTLSHEDLIPEEKMVEKFYEHVNQIADKHRSRDIARRWLRLSKKLDTNPLGEWGKASSPNVKTRGIKDYAFLVMKKHGSPMHFREVAKAIEETFGKKAHTATCHNELIKDARFVLVGRGVYALKEWGYKAGVVRDVIADLIREHGPMTKEEIVDKVLKERYLKKNTIMVNLQNPKYFTKSKDGKFSLAGAMTK